MSWYRCSVCNCSNFKIERNFNWKCYNCGNIITVTNCSFERCNVGLPTLYHLTDVKLKERRPIK